MAAKLMLERKGPLNYYSDRFIGIPYEESKIITSLFLPCPCQVIQHNLLLLGVQFTAILIYIRTPLLVIETLWLNQIMAR